MRRSREARAGTGARTWSRTLGWLLAVVILAAPNRARAQQIKLYLKDGSSLLVKSYQVQGAKLRFYNLDTGEWEEMPATLVDFNATDRARQNEAAARQKTLEQAKVLDKERFDPVAARPSGFEVAPGLYLPTTEGVYAYDGLRVIPLIQSQGEMVNDKERAVLNMALPAPLLKKRALVTLPGTEAAVRLSAPEPVFYIQANDGWAAKAELIPVKSSRSSRVVEKMQSGLGAGASGEVRAAVSLNRREVAKGVYRLQPSEPLKPGEYAIGELIEGKLNLDVWDFGIDRPGKKPKAAPSDSAKQAAMSERRPGETTAKPVDVIRHPRTSSDGPPLPGPDSQPPPLPSPPD